MESSNAVVGATKTPAHTNGNTDKTVPVPDVVNNVCTSQTITPNVPVKTDVTPAVKPTTPTSAAVKSTPAPVQPATTAPRPTSVPSAASEASVKNRSRDEKSRKKDDKSVDHVLRALNSLNTTEEKLAAMCKKYADIFDEHRKLQLLNKQTEKKSSLLQREKEQLQGEQSKAILTRSRLENLCRELQRQNKAIKDESLLKIREEEEKRKEVSAKFQTTMNEITALMQQNNDKNMKLRDDNIDMTSKLKSICEQYEIRQQQVEKISKQMQLEQQLADAKIAKLKLEMSTERELLLREKQQLLLELQQYQQRCTESQATEVSLRNQITMYNDKYDEFQKALARSNDVFGGFKGEMDKMSKKICKLEKETSSWKQRWERSHNALLEMAADKQKSEQELSVVSRQLATLQNLCRTLQAERATLIANLKLFQGGNEPSEKTVVEKKCTQLQLNSIANHEDGKVNDSNAVSNQYSQDILASLQDSKTPEPTATTDSTPTPASVSEPQVSVTSPLPDVVETTTACVNNEVCQRIKNLTFEPSAVECPENNIELVKVVAEPTVPEVKEVLRVEQPPASVLEPVQQDSLDEKQSPPQTVNGESPTQLNGSSTPEKHPQQNKPPNSPQSPAKSPVTKKTPENTENGENAKKVKESTKKKKK